VPRWLRSAIVTLGLSLIAGVLALELGLRALGIGNDATMHPDPWPGWVPIPRRVAEITSEDPTLGRRLTIRINSLGLRDVERRVAKPAGTFRVLVLGDSYVEGQQVPLDSTLTRRMERALDGVRGRRVEVWNCGVPGYTTSQELLYLTHVAAGWRPDLVVLCFPSGNDLADCVPEKATSLRNRPFFVLNGGRLVLDRSRFHPDWPGLGWLRIHSRALAWWNGLRQARRIHARERAAAVRTTGAPDDLQIYAVHPDSIWERSWDITGRLMVATRDAARAMGAGFLMVSVSNGVQEHRNARQGSVWSVWTDRPEIALDEPERRLAALAAAHGLDYLPLLPAFRAEAERTGRPLHIGWTGDWNCAGHALAAREIGARIAARLTGGATRMNPLHGGAMLGHAGLLKKPGPLGRRPRA
jgi:hypothetical protein